MERVVWRVIRKFVVTASSFRMALLEAEISEQGADLRRKVGEFVESGEG